ncbi:hypothetical protein QA645_04915 [Bradyrhizobium sp. CIAT3101]|uniref:hypothetical protein n=1 Tax=Bradyrhizobium sp. CIAT3101 TaxID=439387 RepID=UPI0024B18B05|nr:hypothetical protein [Bradyrhizobium sp. CIAT3101]WFU82097.1 hypothetical protein QA645_04915 [Bradyrhizobium sp. CIAT3101]
MTKRKRIKQTESLEKRLSKEAQRLHAKAKLLRPGAVRDSVIRKARQAETGVQISEWLKPPGLQLPKSPQS